MKKNKIITAGVVAAAVLVSGAFADDFGSEDFSFDSFDSSDSSSSSSPVEVGGKLDAYVRDYVASEGVSSAGDSPVAAKVDAQTTIKYSGKKADGTLTLDVNSDTIKDHPEDVVNEMAASVYLGNFKLEAGKMKSVWGKGDKLHVIDNFNADDYSDFIIPDYLDRRIGTPMVKASYGFNYSNRVLSNMKIEGIYTPIMPVDRFRTSGRWTPAQVSSITDTVTEGATKRLTAAYSDYTTAATETGAVLGALNTLSAEATAAKTAYDAATTALSNVNLVYDTVYQKLYDGAYQQAVSAGGTETIAAAAAKSYAESNVESQYETYMKSLDSTYSSTYSDDVSKANDAISATSYDYQETKGACDAALAKYGYSDLETAESTMKADLTDKASKYMYALTQANALNADPSVIYPDTNTLKYGQAGARFTASLGSVDLGMSYYYGHYKQPSVNYDKIDGYLDKYMNSETITEDDKFLTYDQKQTFGIEAATVLWRFNLRGEGCYNLTEDMDGTNPWVHNNSVQWLGGFDIDLPIWNMNVNVQETGTYILNNDRITGSENEKLDVDYSINGFSKNRLVANITTSFDNDKVAPEVTVVYGIENGDVVVLPKLVVRPSDEFAVTASGMYIWSRDENSEFAAWKNNSFVQLGATLTF